MNAKVGMTLGVCAGIAIITGLLYLALAPVEDMPADKNFGRRERIEKAERPEKARRLAKEVKPSIPTQTVAQVERERRPPKMSMPKDWYENLPSAKDRAIGKHIQDAIDNNDLDATKAASAEALTSSSAEVRQNAVDALNWFGKDAIVDLTKYLNDKDPEVARSAFNAWDAAVEMMDNNANRAKLVGMAMQTLKNKDSLAAAVAKLEASEDRKAAVNAIVDVAESGNGPAAKAAKEAYMFITGEEWHGPATARVKAATFGLEQSAEDNE